MKQLCIFLIALCSFNLAFAEVDQRKIKVKKAKKFNAKYAYVVVGVNADKSFDRTGWITPSYKDSRSPYFFAYFSSCNAKTLQAVKRANKDKKNKKYPKDVRNSLKACNSIIPNKYSADFNAPYYVYQVTPGQGITWTSFKVNMNMSEGMYGSIKWDKSITKSAFKREIRENLKGLRYSTIQPGVAIYDTSIEAGNIYYLGEYSVKLSKKAHPEYGDENFYTPYISHFAPANIKFSQDSKTAQSWINENFHKMPIKTLQISKAIPDVYESEFGIYYDGK